MNDDEIAAVIAEITALDAAEADAVNALATLAGHLDLHALRALLVRLNDDYLQRLNGQYHADDRLYALQDLAQVTADLSRRAQRALDAHRTPKGPS